jgi:hypothetical protein
VPLWADTAQVLKTWFEELGEEAWPIAFPNARGKALSREGVDYLLKQAVERAMPACPSLATKNITPHVVRHYLPFLTMSGNVGKHRCKRGSGANGASLRNFSGKTEEVSCYESSISSSIPDIPHAPVAFYEYLTS